MTRVMENWHKSWGWNNYWGNQEPPRIWVAEINSTETSHHLFDPFSLDHLTGGMLAYVILYYALTTNSGSVWPKYDFPSVEFSLLFLLHIAFEVFENSPWVILKFRQKFSRYQGDAVINSVGDQFSFTVGLLTAYLVTELGHWWPVGVLVGAIQLLSYRLGAGPHSLYATVSSIKHRPDNTTLTRNSVTL